MRERERERKHGKRKGCSGENREQDKPSSNVLKAQKWVAEEGI